MTRSIQHFHDQYKDVPPHLLELGAARGREVHDRAFCYASKIWKPPTYDEEIKGYFRSFKNWFDEFVVEFLAGEIELVCHNRRLVGHPDLIVTLKGEKDPVIVDLKTPVTKSRAWRLQCAGYLYLARKDPRFERVARSFVLQLKKSGDPARAIPYEEQERDLLYFLAAVDVVNYLKD